MRRERSRCQMKPGDVLVSHCGAVREHDYYYGSGAGWRGPHYGGGLLGLVLIVLLVLWLSGTMGPRMLR